MLKKLLGMMLAVVLAVSLLPLSAFAEQTDGLSIDQSADKTKYGKKDDITVTLTVRNTDRTRVDYANIQLLNEVPDGYVLKAESSAEMSIPLLKAGQEVVLTSVFHPVNIPTTGDRGIGIPLLIGGIALFCLLFLLSDKKGRFMHFFRSMMCFLLVFSMAVMMLPLTALAASLTIPFSTVVKVEDKEVKLNSLVSYDPLKRVQEESLTIGDILPEDFPTTPDDGWRIDNDRNRVCYKAEDPDTGDKTLDFSFNVDGLMGTYSIPLSNEITEKEGKYEYYKEGCETIAFFMSEGKLEQIYYESYDWIDDPAIGTYTPPIPPYEGPTIADILPNDFPSSDYWTSPPKNAWVTENGSLCFREKDTKIDFYNEGYDDYGHLYQRVVQIYLSSPITKNEDDNYISGDILFVMSGEDIVQIEYNSSREPRGVFTPPQKIGEEALTIADILPDDFPATDDWTSVPENAWSAKNGNRCYKQNNGILYIIHKTDTGKEATIKPLSTPITENGDNYICDAITFVMSGGKLVRIEHNNGTQYDGVYAPPYEGPTIADILPIDFPTTDSGTSVPENAWIAENGNRCYKENDYSLDFYHVYSWDRRSALKIPLSTPVTKDGENYISKTITFVMSEGKLVRIEYHSDTQYEFKGIYVSRSERTTIGDILPDDFPTTDSWYYVPENAWVAENGNHCYIVEDTLADEDTLYFVHENYQGMESDRILLNTPLTKNGENYIYGTITFVMSEDKLERIEYNSGTQYDGIYASPAPPEKIGTEELTIADILPDDFPTTDSGTSVPENAWIAENGNRCYKENDYSLDFYHVYSWDRRSALKIPLSTPVTKDGENYISKTITFVMSEGKLVRIEYHSNTQHEFDGLYVSRSERTTIGDILPDDFPTTDDWYFVPENAWVAENGNHCYIESIEIEDEDTLYFVHEIYTSMESNRILLNTPLTKNGENYIYETITFVMSEDKLERIEYNSGTQYDGIYASPAPPEKIGTEELTIADILPDDFPTDDDHAWRCDHNRICTVDGTHLWFTNYLKGMQFGYPIDDPVTESEGNYVYDCTTYLEEFEDYIGYKVTFVMSEGKLASIEMKHYDYPGFNGTYTKPKEGMTKEAKTVADILPDDFPTDVDHAWRYDRNRICMADGTNLWFINYLKGMSQTLPFDFPVTESEGNYVYDNTTYLEEFGEYIGNKVTFVMSEGKLASIEMIEYDYPSFTGTYSKP